MKFEAVLCNGQSRSNVTIELPCEEIRATYVINVEGLMYTYYGLVGCADGVNRHMFRKAEIFEPVLVG